MQTRGEEGNLGGAQVPFQPISPDRTANRYVGGYGRRILVSCSSFPTLKMPEICETLRCSGKTKTHCDSVLFFTSGVNEGPRELKRSSPELKQCRENLLPKFPAGDSCPGREI